MQPNNFFHCSVIYFNWRVIRILWWFLLYVTMNQPQAYMCPLPPESASHLLPQPIPPGCNRALALGSLKVFLSEIYINRELCKA